MSRRAVAQAKTRSVMPVAAGLLQRSCACGTHTVAGGECEACKKKQDSGLLQRAALGGQPVAEVPPIVSDVLRASGQPLDHSTRGFFEPRFGHDFSRVRVHTDARAAESARAVSALAYTVGNNIVLGAGQHAPHTEAGRRLLAHELTHVLQQSGNGSALQPARVNSPDGADEHEADRISHQVMAGQPFAPPRANRSSLLQRKMLNKVETDFQTGAKACVVHLHGEEKTALAVAKEVRTRRCVNLVHLDTSDRYVRFEIDVAGEKHICAADPNRVFSDKGRKDHALNDKGCHLAKGPAGRTDTSGKNAANVKSAAVTELENFVNSEWGKKISECRGGQGPAVTDGTLPTLALHNNEKGAAPLLDQYKGVAEKGDRLPEDPAKPGKKMANPSMKSGEEPNDFFLVTDPKDFKALSATRNVLLQADPVPASGEDGSLSVALQHQRFINVEKLGRSHDKPVMKGGFKVPDDVYVKNYAMATEALDLFGVPEGPCPKAPAAAPPQRTMKELLIEFIEFLDEIIATMKGEKLPTDEPVLDREPAPDPRPKGCMFFESKGDLDAQKEVWKQKLGRMPLNSIISWITGGPDPIPAEAKQEFERQQKCMIDAMDAKGKLPKGAKKTAVVKSERRTFADQEGIWQRKFKFEGGDFGHISDFARSKCGTAIDPKDVVWQPKSKKSHKTCWDSLSGEEKEKEILMTSSAPGVSRHHAGTDFDFGRTDKDLEPEAWTGTGDFAPAHRWLVRNASRYGFIQPFQTKGGYGKGYTTERWHWSYYPIAQALFEFTKEHEAEVDQSLQSLWQSKGTVKPEYQFIAKHWRDYIYNVETRPRF